ncbi:hypothetical protein PtA15_8A534 [Puccinia triticina]|uniref:Uncharacterized protein n=1 Tax=Puccinia triticina TaxID=208348 RepID=A0ABY7CQT4_9BASI|nr:uncharacterized protein PtA15_8A534 [Puccinia triticina]WAQ87629.1 hypothetical protein PtA15_8A534 [Puccinia triticina]
MRSTRSPYPRAGRPCKLHGNTYTTCPSIKPSSQPSIYLGSTQYIYFIPTNPATQPPPLVILSLN